MEEITIRFEIVRLAVKMADHETVQIQANKLREISLDEDLNEIIGLLESRNYRQGLYLMKGYMSSLDDSFFNPPPVEKPKQPKKQEPQQETQNLFDMMQPQASKTINLDDMLRMTVESASETVGKERAETVPQSYIAETKEKVKENDAYLDIHKNRVENKAIVEDIQENQATKESLYNPLDDQVEIIENIQQQRDTVENHVQELSIEIEEEEIAVTEVLERDLDEDDSEAVATVSETLSTDGEIEKVQEIVVDEMLETVKENLSPETISVEESISEVHVEEVELPNDVVVTIPEPTTIESNEETEYVEIEIETPHKEEMTEVREILSAEEAEIQEIDIALTKPKQIESQTESYEEEKVSEVKSKADYTYEQRRYPPISYIDQKFRNMRHQFPQVEPISDISHDVTLLLKQMATKGYTENDIRDTIAEFQKKKNAGYKDEAAQLLLIAAASESKYAQLLLARELFKGEVLVADYPESFTQINRLAEHDYPEAVCDLAQLYEYGYGIKKDKKTALLLYQEAADMGIERAQKHVERLGSRKGLLGFLKR